MTFLSSFPGIFNQIPSINIFAHIFHCIKFTAILISFNRTFNALTAYDADNSVNVMGVSYHYVPEYLIFAQSIYINKQKFSFNQDYHLVLHTTFTIVINGWGGRVKTRSSRGKYMIKYVKPVVPKERIVNKTHNIIYSFGRSIYVQ